MVARRVTRGRLVSLTDPCARHGRKSKSGLFSGFKLHVLGDVVSGLVASLAVTPGNSTEDSPGTSSSAWAVTSRSDVPRRFARPRTASCSTPKNNISEPHASSGPDLKYAKPTGRGPSASGSFTY